MWARELRLEDAKKLLDYLGLKESRLEWITKPTESGWYYWKQSENLPIRSVLMLPDGKKINAVDNKLIEKEEGRFALIYASDFKE